MIEVWCITFREGKEMAWYRVKWRLKLRQTSHRTDLSKMMIYLILNRLIYTFDIYDNIYDKRSKISKSVVFLFNCQNRPIPVTYMNCWPTLSGQICIWPSYSWIHSIPLNGCQCNQKTIQQEIVKAGCPKGGHMNILDNFFRRD